MQSISQRHPCHLLPSLTLEHSNRSPPLTLTAAEKRRPPSFFFPLSTHFLTFSAEKGCKKNDPNWIFRHINRLEYRSKRISPEKSVPLFLLWEQNRQLDKADSAASSMGRLLKAKRVNPKYMCIAKTTRGRCGGLSADHRRRCRGCILWRKEELLKEVGDASGGLTVPFQRFPL